MAEAPTGGAPLLVRDGTGRATITLNRPAHLNRLHREDLRTLQAHVAAVAADSSVRVLVITAAGRAFCAGFNLVEMNQPDGAEQDPQLFERTVDALEALPIPTLAALNGSVYGGATDLALACDFRVGVQGMELRMPAVRLGLHYYPSGLQRYVSRLGLAAAKRLFMLAQAHSGETLLQMGFLDALVEPAALPAHVEALAAELLAGAPLAMAGMKQSLNEIARGDANAKVLRQRVAACAASADLREGLQAQAEKRKPRFTGN
jgi:enoyl-CoA hydratase